MLTALLCAASLAPAPALARERTPPGSFLKYRAATVQELVSQISSDSSVRARYARHFGVTQQQIASSLGAGLKLVSLTRPAKVQSWYVGKGGRLQAKTKLLPRGTLVFAGSDGRPLLAWSCGNPLRAQLPQQLAKKPKEKAKGAVESVASAPPAAAEQPAPTAMATQGSAEENVETKVLAQPVETIGTEPVSAIPGFVPTEVPAAEPMVVAQALPVAAAMPAAIAPAAAVSGGFSAIQALGGLAGVLGGLAAAASLNSKDSSPEPLIPPAPIPEPTGLTVLATGLAFGLSAARVHRSRRRR